MSIITDAVEKKKQEEEAKKAKAIDLEHPPKVFVPRDRRRFRRVVALIVILIFAAGAAGAGYYYRNQIKDFLAMYLPKTPESETAPTELEKNIADKNINDSGVKEDINTESGNIEKKEEPSDEFPELNVSGIIFDPLDPEAIINGQSVKTGEEIEGAFVVEIRRDSVRVRYKGKERVIRHR